MAYINAWDKYFENFTRTLPSAAEKVVDWWPSGRFEITMKLEDGSRVIYNDLNNTSRFVRHETFNADISSEDEWKNIFASRLTDLMRVNFISAGELSDRTGLSRQIVSSYINGRRIPNGYNLVKIAKAIGCSVTELTEFVELEER